ncbi:glycoside hydrolase family 16 protein [Macrolepiota fuliginosa MF-IS2]|uniref:Glycoside hydrolase family 16 protein n=1 Tax=Macrolepiota fuliginosa MF-IS2 TaxID=1400762 RepID=A0A9P6BVZ8_9AGAR|nr:glycoside hydrolase family 16 protein [Macrolepiota fuliginosa MF-IS2]
MSMQNHWYGSTCLPYLIGWIASSKLDECKVCGAIHAKAQITVTKTNTYTSGEFSSLTAKGTWPAFWHSEQICNQAVNNQPPKTDMANGRAQHKTGAMPSTPPLDLISWPSDLSFHALKAALTAECNGANVRIDFYMDNIACNSAEC